MKNTTFPFSMLLQQIHQFKEAGSKNKLVKQKDNC